MPIYPPIIHQLASATEHVGTLADASATGRAANFVCGSFMRFDVAANGPMITKVRYSTNGCGFMLAAASILAEAIEGRELTGLQGLDDKGLAALIHARCGSAFASDRVKCVDAAIEALHAAFAALRDRRVLEAAGADPLICTCFGISQAVIEHNIKTRGSQTVEDVTADTNAGGGCGSCQMLIEEILAGDDML